MPAIIEDANAKNNNNLSIFEVKRNYKYFKLKKFFLLIQKNPPAYFPIMSFCYSYHI